MFTFFILVANFGVCGFIYDKLINLQNEVVKLRNELTALQGLTQP